MGNRDAIGRYVYIRYEDPNDAFRPYDDRCLAVAARVTALIEAAAPWASVEHIGSTAIPGCDGKGVIDLMALYGDGMLTATREAVDRLGFQRQTNPEGFPEERPVRVGTILFDGTEFRIHVHVISADAEEAGAQIRFRDALRSDPPLVAEYVAVKRRIFEGGVIDSTEYNQGKHAFIRQVMGIQDRL